MSTKSNFKFINLIKNQYNKIGLIQLNNITKKNSINHHMLKELTQGVKSLNEDNQIKVVLIQSLCPGVFSSGHDLKELHENRNNYDKIKQIIFDCSDLMMKINLSNKIYIAEVNGLATAAGLQLASSCDFTICSRESKFSIPGMNIGLYAATPAINLIKNLPRKIAFEMMLRGRVLNAEETYKYGLAYKIIYSCEDTCIDEKIREESLKISEKILKFVGEDEKDVDNKHLMIEKLKHILYSN
jgi:enoyl-CoA hydratase/carnithine racemase